MTARAEASPALLFLIERTLTPTLSQREREKDGEARRGARAPHPPRPLDSRLRGNDDRIDNGGKV